MENPNLRPLSTHYTARRLLSDTDLRTLKDHQADFMEAQARRVLLVGLSGRYVAENMSDLNYKGVPFTSGAELIAWLDNLEHLSGVEMPRAIICENILPDGDAYSLFEKLKANERLAPIPFIVFSQEENAADKVKAFQSGVDDYYPFPLSFKDLHKRIVFLRQFKEQKAKALTESDDSLFRSHIPLSKRLFDIVFAATALFFLSPLFLIVALLIRLESRGGVFYTSKRVGTGYKIFDFYKFRSMRSGADAELSKLRHLNQYGEGKFVKIANDPRITRIGQFIRSTSIDELPQLINVLKGDMSIVGNRPLPIYEAEQLTVDRWSKRFLAPAGITGLWQVTKRGKKEMSEEERMELDVLYARKYSLWFDLQIMLKTLPALFQKEKV